MATENSADVILHLRHLIGDDVEPYTFTDEQLDAWLVQSDGNVRQAASDYWYRKASSHAESVDITEAGSSRKNSDMFKHALEMAKNLSDGGGGTADETPASTTRRIVRR